MPAIDDQIRKYLHDTVGVAWQPAPWAGSDQLPLFLTNRYRFIEAMLLGHPTLFMIDRSRTEESPAAIRKHMAQIQPGDDRRVVYVRPSVTAYNRKRLIQHGVPFIVPGNQMYLPSLGIDLREHFRRQVQVPKHFRPGTQAIFIEALLRERSGSLVAAELARVLEYTPMTLSRAFDEIEAAGLGESQLVGRERCLRFTAPPRETWQRAQTVLGDPVRSRYFVDLDAESTVRESPGPSAGLSALARYSTLAEPRNPVVAVSARHWTTLREQEAVRVLPFQEPEALVIEVWRYAPRPYREPGLVDPLSLHLSLRDVHDERVESALEHMLETLPW